jgi:hypothetical protein
MLCMSSDAVGMGSSGKGLIMYVSGDLNEEREHTQRHSEAWAI